MEYANLMTRHCICTYLDLACQKFHFIGPEVDWSLGAFVTRLTTSVYVTVDRFRSSFAYNCPKCQFTRVPRCYSGHFNHYSLFVDSLHCPYSVQVLFLSWRLNPTEHPWTLEGPRGDLQQEGVVVSPEKKNTPPANVQSSGTHLLVCFGNHLGQIFWRKYKIALILLTVLNLYGG